MDIFRTAERQFQSAEKARAAALAAESALDQTRTRFHQVMGQPRGGVLRAMFPHKNPIWGVGVGIAAVGGLFGLIMALLVSPLGLTFAAVCVAAAYGLYRVPSHWMEGG